MPTEFHLTSGVCPEAAGFSRKPAVTLLNAKDFPSGRFFQLAYIELEQTPSAGGRFPTEWARPLVFSMNFDKKLQRILAGRAAVSYRFRRHRKLPYRLSADTSDCNSHY